MDVRVRLWRKLSAEKLMLFNCGAAEDSWESLGMQGNPTSPSWRRLSPGCSLEGLMLKLKLQYFGHLTLRVDSLEKTLMLGGIGGRRRRGRQRMRWLDGITDLMGMSLSEPRELVMTGRPGVLQFMGSQRVRHDLATELNWTLELPYDPEISFFGIYPEKKNWSERIHAPQYLLQHCLQWPRHERNLNVHQQSNG